MAQTNIGDVIKEIMNSNGWKQRMLQIRIKKEWDKIAGKTVAKYTENLFLYHGVLTITTAVGPLKQELRYAKQNLIQNINQYFNEDIVNEIVIK